MQPTRQTRDEINDTCKETKKNRNELIREQTHIYLLKKQTHGHSFSDDVTFFSKLVQMDIFFFYFNLVNPFFPQTVALFSPTRFPLKCGLPYVSQHDTHPGFSLFLLSVRG